MADSDDPPEADNGWTAERYRVDYVQVRLAARMIADSLIIEDPTAPNARSLEECLDEIAAKKVGDPVQDARALARRVYAAEQLPTGTENWALIGSQWEPVVSFTGGREEAFESELWERFGKPKFGVAWAASKVLEAAFLVERFSEMADAVAGQPPSTGRVTHSQAVEGAVRSAFELGQSLEVLFAKMDLPENANRSAEQVLESGLKSIGANIGRTSLWEGEFFSIADEFCRQRPKTSYGALVIEARAWRDREKAQGRNCGLPATDKAIIKGIKRLEERRGLLRRREGN